MLFSGGKLVAAIFPFAQRIFSIVRGRDIRGRFLKKFEVLENLASPFPEKGWKGKDTSERCRQIGTTCEKSSPFM